jgi:hypothetical protein
MIDRQSWSPDRPIVREAWHTGEAKACPACDQTVKIYPRRITSLMIKNLAQIVASPDGIRSVDLQHCKGGDHAKLRYWALVLSDLCDEIGLWYPTKLGRKWLLGQAQVPEIAYVYNGEVVSYSDTMVRVRDRVGKHFDYDELMSRWAVKDDDPQDSFLF